MRFATISTVLSAATSASLASAAEPEPPAGPLQLRAEAELGFLAPLSHRVQFSRDGSRIDYVDEGGQDVLFPFSRLATTLRVSERHAITLLYQPLELESREVASRDLRIDDEVFSRGTPMRFRYSFPFWRAGYSYDVHRTPHSALGLGGALQIRDATIEFESLDGEQLRSNRDVGPVPLLRVYFEHALGQAGFIEAEADGFYAPVKYINGGDSDVVGAILDTSVRLGIELRYDTEAFFNVRYLGGGAEGTGDDRGPGDGYTSNWLHFMTVSLGARANLL